MDREQLASVVAQIPEGHWASYGDVAHAARSNPRALNQMFVRAEIPGAHRVLRSDGSVSGALADPAATRRQLEEEGLEFDDGKAAASRRTIPIRIAPPAPPAQTGTAPGEPSARTGDESKQPASLPAPPTAEPVSA